MIDEEPEVDDGYVPPGQCEKEGGRDSLEGMRGREPAFGPGSIRIMDGSVTHGLRGDVRF